MRIKLIKIKGYFIYFLLFSSPLISAPNGDWSFPRDHGAHLNFKHEWWYFTGHIIDKENNHHGVQVTFFRNKMKTVSKNKSIYNNPNLYTGHVAWSNIKEKTFNHDEIIGRPGFSKLTISTSNMTVKLKSWHLTQKNNTIIINIPASFGTIKLKLKPEKNKVFHGKNGKSAKGPDPNQFSYYYSYPKLTGQAEIKTKKNVYQSDQISFWMDREIFNQSVNETQKGWDWFAIQFKNDTQLMCFQVRGKTKKTNFKSGTFIKENGETIPINHNEIQFKAIGFWTSKKTKITYPIQWKINIPKLNINIEVNRRLNNQELTVYTPFPLSYWEGKCNVSGSHQGQAYIELVGYHQKKVLK